MEGHDGGATRRGRDAPAELFDVARMATAVDQHYDAQTALRRRSRTRTGEELLDRVEDRVLVADVWVIVDALELHVLRALNVARQVPASFHVGDELTGAVHD